MLRKRTVVARATSAVGGGIAALSLAAGVLLLAGPIALVIWLSFGGDLFTVVPPESYSLRWYANVFKTQEFVAAFRVSAEIAFITTLVSLTVGTLAAFALDKYALPGRSAFQAAIYSPISIPTVVTGIALLFFFSRIGFHNSFWNIAVGHIIITFPYVVRTVSVALARYDRSLDEAAASLGAHPVQVFWRVTLPVIRPGLFAGALFAFVLSFDDFTVSMFLIGTNTHTLPVAIYQYMEFNVNPTVSAISALLVLMSVVLMLGVERLIGLNRFIGLRG